MTTRRGARGADLDHHDWIDETPPRERRAAERRTLERRAPVGRPPSGQAPAPERRAGERRAGADRRAAPRRPQPARRTGAPHAAALGPGVGERRALVFITVLLLLYGLVMAYSASAAEAYFEHGSSFYLIQRQAIYAALGLGVMWVLSRVDYAWYRKLALPFSALALLGLVAVLMPAVGTTINGARRWIFIGGQSVTPSEFAKLAVVILVAALIAARPGEVTTPRGFIRLVLIGIAPAAALIMMEPDLGTTIVLVGAVCAVLVAGGARLRHLFALLAVGMTAVLALIVAEPYRMQRLTTFLDPWADPQGTGFQATQSLISIASGRIFGVGLGNSVQKFGYLPEQSSDMITGIIGEELGLIGLVVLLVLYAALAWACFRIALECRELFGKLLATGITAIIAGQACINIGAALGVLPLTGVPLPLVSLGGTSLLVVLAGLGILLNIATNRRSYIVVSAQRQDRAARGRGDRRPPPAHARRRR
jgi:cell division protein FtsW